ncbi:hypothetical protein GUY61_22280 [Streptomyces sp. GC420]|nr:hypothetical protein [Streptomyces sp. GC420]
MAGGSRRSGWLALGAAAIGAGVWITHFIAMTGFTVAGAPIRYDAATAFAGLAAGVLMTGIGVFIACHRGPTAQALFTGGVITGLGIAATHYLGMAGLRLRADLAYDTSTVTASVLIAVVAATTALWIALSAKGFRAGLAASLLMGLAVFGMHYTAMAAVDVRLHDTTGPAAAATPLSPPAPMMAGPAVFLLLAGLVVVIEPLVVTGGPGRRRTRPGPAAVRGRPVRR